MSQPPNIAHLVVLLIVIGGAGLTIWALVTTLRASDIAKYELIIWCSVLLFVPLVGLVVWALVWATRPRPRSGA